MKVTKQNVKKAGFSLVEMLVVIAVIGIIAAIAVPNIGKINDSAKEARQKRNAQSLASVASSAAAAGLNFVDPTASGTNLSLTATIQGVIAGDSVSDEGPFEDTFFGVPGLSATQAVDATKGAAKFLKIQNGMLVYIGGQLAADAPAP